MQKRKGERDGHGEAQALFAKALIADLVSMRCPMQMCWKCRPGTSKKSSGGVALSGTTCNGCSCRCKINGG